MNTEDLENEEGSQKVLSVCLDEIDRCRSYMLVILGERYGWIPEPETMLTVEKKREGLDPNDLEKSVTALEIEYGALHSREQLSHTLFYFREFEGTIRKNTSRRIRCMPKSFRNSKHVSGNWQGKICTSIL